jgi:hypothetical protein
MGDASERERPVPPITEAMRAEAARKPGQWLYVVDPAFDPDGAVPPYGVVGAWKVDERGEIISGAFRPNEHYRPSPVALGLPAPTDPVDRAVQRAATGHGSEAELVEALLGSEVFVFDLGTGDLYVIDDEQGPKLQVFTAEDHLPRRDEFRWRRLAGREVARRVAPGADVQVNPGSPASVRIPGAHLVD